MNLIDPTTMVEVKTSGLRRLSVGASNEVRWVMREGGAPPGSWRPHRTSQLLTLRFCVTSAVNATLALHG
jgi:hypothetical protein